MKVLAIMGSSKGKEFHEDLFNEVKHHFQSILNQDYEKQIGEELGNKL
jgi:NAD(P)H-dependent FMN reductase